MTWEYQGQVVDQLPDNCVGFVYLIENLTNGRKYIGKKLAFFSKTSYKTIKQKNGTKKKKRIKTKIESDWKDYYSSSDELKADVEIFGKDSFRREILRICKDKNECNYWEAKYQFEYDVLLKDEWYNSWIMVRVRKSKSLLI
jgi:hypothetical protein